MLEIPKRTGAVNGGQHLEILVCGGRGGDPFQRPGIPGVIAGAGALPQADDDVVGEYEDSQPDHESPDGGDHVVDVPTLAAVPAVDPARHAQQSDDVEREDCLLYT